MPSQESEYHRQILQAVASGKRLTQRSLASEMGVALGLTNLLIRRLASKGYIRVTGMGTRHVRYLMTPAGWEALARVTRLSIENTVHLYTETREQIRRNLSSLSEYCMVDAKGRKPVVFFGIGDVAEIAYVSLQGTDLTLVGAVDDRRQGDFFDVAILPPTALSADSLNDIPYSHVVVTSIRHSDAIQRRASALGVPAERIYCLAGPPFPPPTAPGRVPGSQVADQGVPASSRGEGV